eukprot:CAMPEP_0175329846 /NCGR_PEP_ID=MMETSP0095-20121207/415_1 /TAXON_ID=311494 /ORGANISM="Alexandrium monilatum, Strain CCMP3105" /LENGTH=70 /DNA_ID=CAMNT_0016627001 /DNA_START=125 /DNA_END=334 /DNA_ORIENTATION=-
MARRMNPPSQALELRKIGVFQDRHASGPSSRATLAGHSTPPPGTAWGTCPQVSSADAARALAPEVDGRVV